VEKFPLLCAEHIVVFPYSLACSAADSLLIHYPSVVQLLLTYELLFWSFYENVTTRGPLRIKWCFKQQIHKIKNWKGKIGELRESVIEIITKLQ